jgi:hypothetical protein
MHGLNIEKLKLTLHELTHYGVTLKKDGIGEVFICHRRLRPTKVVVELTDMNGATCGAFIDYEDLADLIRLLAECSNTNQAHTLIHDFGARFDAKTTNGV